MAETAFQLVQVIYWLSLSTWFGAVLFVAVATPVIFKTVLDHKPILPDVLSVNLENQHGTLLAGSIVGDLVAYLARVQMVCAIVLGVALFAQAFTTELGAGDGLLRSTRGAYTLRILLFVAAVAMTLYNWRVVWPRAVGFRRTFIENADDPDVANPARDDFDREQSRLVPILMAVVAMLSGIIVFSVNVIPRATDLSTDRPAAAPTAPPANRD
jgi:hypothetical protein